MIQFENATRTYGNKVAVSDLSLTIPSGELFALLVPLGPGLAPLFVICLIVGARCSLGFFCAVVEGAHGMAHAVP